MRVSALFTCKTNKQTHTHTHTPHTHNTQHTTHNTPPTTHTTHTHNTYTHNTHTTHTHTTHTHTTHIHTHNTPIHNTQPTQHTTHTHNTYTHNTHIHTHTHTHPRTHAHTHTHTHSPVSEQICVLLGSTASPPGLAPVHSSQPAQGPSWRGGGKSLRLTALGLGVLRFRFTLFVWGFATTWAETVRACRASNILFNLPLCCANARLSKGVCVAFRDLLCQP